MLSKLKSRCLLSHYHQLELNSPLQKCIIFGFLPIFILKVPVCGQVLSCLAYSNAISVTYSWEARAGKPHLGALKVIWLLRLHSPLEGMICRALVGDSGVTAFGSQECLQVGIQQKDTASVPAPSQSQTLALHHFPWFLEHIYDTVSTVSSHHFKNSLALNVLRSYFCIA